MSSFVRGSSFCAVCSSSGGSAGFARADEGEFSAPSESGPACLAPQPERHGAPRTATASVSFQKFFLLRTVFSRRRNLTACAPPRQNLKEGAELRGGRKLAKKK